VVILFLLLTLRETFISVDKVYLCDLKSMRESEQEALAGKGFVHVVSFRL